MLRRAIRSLVLNPGFAVTAILTIALGVGANTAVYAVVHAVLLEPLPFREPDRLVQVWESHPDIPNLQVAVPDYLDWKASVKTMDLAAYTFQAMDKGTLLGQGTPVAVQATNVSPELFGLLGVNPSLDSTTATGNPALISEHLWHTAFGTKGGTFRLGTSSFTVGGVVPDRSAFPKWADIWMSFDSIDPALKATRKFHPLEVIGRLKPGVSIVQAELEMEQIARNLAKAYPSTNGRIGAHVVSLTESYVGAVRPALILAWAAVCLVLLIACANLAHLMMTRALNRRGEIAVRLALGASHFTILRMFLLETWLLSIGGGLLGIAAGGLALPFLRRAGNGQIPRLEEITLDGNVLACGVLLALLISLIFATPAYFHAFEGGRGYSTRRSPLARLLMGSEVAFSIAVLVTAILLVRSALLALDTPPGFEYRNVTLVHAPLIDRDWEKSAEFLNNRLAPALEQIPGVREVAAVNSAPMTLGATEHSRFATRFGIVGRQFDPGRFPTAQLRWATPGYFRVLGIPLISGRFLNQSDYNQRRYLINQSFARKFFPDVNAVGQNLLLGVVTPQPERVEVVGVVGDVRDFGLTSPPEPTMYSIGTGPEMDVLVSGLFQGLPNAIATAMRRVNPEAASGPVKPLASYVAASLARERFLVTLMCAFALIALCLCAVGVYGVFSYSVTRRLREFGIRFAVGAQKNDVLGQVLSECVAVVIPGAAAGLALSLASARLVRSVLYRVSPADPLSSVLAVLSVVGLCLACVLLPAFRAARADVAGMLRDQ